MQPAYVGCTIVWTATVSAPISAEGWPSSGLDQLIQGFGVVLISARQAPLRRTAPWFLWAHAAGLLLSDRGAI